MSYTKRDEVRDLLADEQVRALEATGVINYDVNPDTLDKIIIAITGRSWEEAKNAIAEYAEQWHQDHYVQPYEGHPPPEYVQGVYAGLGLARRVLDGEL